MLPQTSSGGCSSLPSEHFGMGGLIHGIMAELPAWPEQDEPESESWSSWSALSREPQPAEPCKPAEPSERRGSSVDWEDDFKLQPRVRVIFELPSGDILEKTFTTIPSYAELWLTIRERVPRGGYQLFLDEVALSNANAVGLLKGVVEAAVASSAAPAVQVSVFYPTTQVSALDAEDNEKEAVKDEKEEEGGKPWKAAEPPAEAPPGGAPRHQPQSWGSLLPSRSVVGAVAAGGALTWLLIRVSQLRGELERAERSAECHAREVLQLDGELECAKQSAEWQACKVSQLHGELESAKKSAESQARKVSQLQGELKCAKEAKDKALEQVGVELQGRLQDSNKRELEKISGIRERVPVTDLRRAVIGGRCPLWLWPGTWDWIERSIHFAQARERERSEELAQAVRRAHQEALEVVSSAIEKERTQERRSRL